MRNRESCGDLEVKLQQAALQYAFVAANVITLRAHLKCVKTVDQSDSDKTIRAKRAVRLLHIGRLPPCLAGRGQKKHPLALKVDLQLIGEVHHTHSPSQPATDAISAITHNRTLDVVAMASTSMLKSGAMRQTSFVSRVQQQRPVARPAPRQVRSNSGLSGRIARPGAKWSKGSWHPKLPAGPAPGLEMRTFTRH